LDLFRTPGSREQGGAPRTTPTRSGYACHSRKPGCMHETGLGI
jgi:hypothetical protein